MDDLDRVRIQHQVGPVVGEADLGADREFFRVGVEVAILDGDRDQDRTVSERLDLVVGGAAAQAVAAAEKAGAEAENAEAEAEKTAGDRIAELTKERKRIGKSIEKSRKLSEDVRNPPENIEDLFKKSQ